MGRVLINAPIGIAPGSARYRNGVFEFTLSGTEGDSMILQAATDLTHWTQALAQRLGGYEQAFADTNTALFKQRFYRLVREGSYLHLASSLTVAGQGLGTNGAFRFNLPPSIEVPLVVEASTNMLNWAPVMTNPLTASASVFVDTASTNLPARFYRLRLSR